MKESKLFTKAELESFKIILLGDRSDPTGIFYGRVKPKLLEIKEWIKRRKDIEKALKPKRKVQQ